jgi:hypothetical protein
MDSREPFSAFSMEDLVMLRKAMVGLAAATLWSVVVPHVASAQQHCYGTPGIARCAGVGLGLHSPRWLCVPKTSSNCDAALESLKG